MSLASVVALTVLMTLLGLGIHAFVLWVSARLFRIGPISYRRALATWLVVSVACLPAAAAESYLEAWVASSQAASESQALAAMLAILAFMLWVVWFTVRRFLDASWWKAAAAGLTTLVVGFVVNVLLAFSVKAYLFDGFRVPAGSMAPTILGTHADVTCTNCGLAYPVSLSERVGPWAGQEAKPIAVACPNCAQPDEVPLAATMRSGDRILVEKRAMPKRWQLAVFRPPEDPSVTFVKRVAGLPGEKVELFGGDLFVNGNRLFKEPAEAADLWLFAHDTALVPRTDRDGLRWKPAQKPSKWRHAAGAWRFSGEAAEAETLSLEGSITDALAYNGPEAGPWNPPPPLLGDVLLESYVAEFQGSGSLELRWEFQRRRASATIFPNVSAELAVFDLPNRGEAEVLERERTGGQLTRMGSQPWLLSFAIRDGQAYVLENGRLVAQIAVAPQDLREAKAAATSKEPCRLSIAADHCRVSLSRIRLFKDVYYRRVEQMAGPAPSGNDSAELGADSYWMLGDNSSQSRDSRFLGPIRAEAVVGVARWLYWPPRRAHEFR